MKPEPLRRELDRRAREEGFDAVGVAAVEPLGRDADALARWLGRGMHAEMHWMTHDPAKRADPSKLLPGCRSVAALAMNYWPGDDENTGSDAPRVARYALGRDYHKVLSRKSKRLAAWLEDATGQASRAFVDTAPVLERAWAERAGVGWIGKNANLLTREMGSWVLLCEILTAAAIEPDPGPHADFCGSCTACLDGCPTGAIVEAGVVDSNLCISYWTIEHRGTVPRERRAGTGDWIFGCDLCQEVCPWNESFSRSVEAGRFERRPDLRRLDPEEILAMDEATFRARYSGTSLMRAKWEGMRRNACIVLGNRARQGSLAALGRALEDDDPVVRAHAAWAVGRIGGDAAMGLLRAACEREREPAVADEIVHALGAAGGS